MPVRYAGLAALLLAVFALAAGPAAAQTWPAPYDLSQGDYTFTAWPEDSPAETYPAHMRFHRGPGQDPAPSAEPNADYTDGYAASAGSRINGLGSEGFSFLNTGTDGNLGAAVLALNTTGLQNVQVSWTGGTVAAGPRPYVIRLQYRVGASGPFTDVPGPVEYVAGAAGHSQPFVTTLPAAVNDQPVVYVRWRYAQNGSGGGARPRLRVDDITVTTSDSPSSGTGTAVVEPAVLQGGLTHTLAFVVTARSDDAEDRLTHVDLTLPEGFGPISAGNVTLTPAGGAVEVIGGRTVRVSGADVSQSTPLRISISGLAVPDVSGAFAFGVRTGAGSAQTIAIAAQPELLVWGTPEAVAAVKANDAQGVSTRLGDWVTVRGVVTVSDQFQTGGGEIGPSYFEDATGGMAVFSPDGVSADVEIGDEVTLLGRVDQFFGLNQLDARTVVVASSPAEAVEPAVVTLAQLAADGAGGVEVWEGRLVRVNGVTVNTTVWNAEGAGTNYQLSDGTATLDIRINGAVDFAGQPAPSGPFDVVGVVSQFRPSPPNIGGYQLMPRFSADIIDDSSAPAITSAAPFESAATPTSVTLTWTTDRAAHSEVRYVSYSSGEAGAIVDAAPKTQHAVTLTGLDPATVYTVEIRSAVGEDTTRIAGYPVVTRAPEGTTHAINVVFTGSVDHDLALETPAVSGSPLPWLLDRINAAQHSIDVALYSLSGTTGSAIASALIAAHQRGVAVRVVMEDANSSTAPPTALRNAGVPFITDAFGSGNTGQGLHHHKFGVFDAYAEEPGAAWVFTGSWNPTDPGTQQHKQNVIFIQDASAAAAYTREFDQMWGSRTAVPSAAEARFGARKQLVAPTVLWLGDTQARLFFSPQGFGVYGSTEQQIIRALGAAEHEIDLGLNLITRIGYVDAMRARFEDGVKVRGAIGETSTTGSVFDQLAAWADVHAHSASEHGLLHHKYALVDAEHPAANPVTITGSHNWSRAANEANDENTLFLYSADVTNQFLQEFAQRYREAGGEGGFEVSVEALPAQGDLAFSLSGNYPNPFATTTTFTYTLGAPSAVSVRVYDVLGREVARVLEAEPQPAGAYRVTFDAAHLPSGVYLYRVEAATASGHASETGRMVIVR